MASKVPEPSVSRAGELPQRTPRNTARPGTPMLMQLPPSIRRSVYTYLGLPVQEMVSLNPTPRATDVRPGLRLNLDRHNSRPNSELDRSMLHEGPGCRDDTPRGTPEAGSSDRPDGHRWGPIQSLLLTSKDICTEIRHIFFSENILSVSHNRRKSLQPLLDIGPSGWRELREVVVILQPCGSIGYECSHPGFQRYVRGTASLDLLLFVMHDPLWEHFRPFDDGVHQSDARSLRQWERICEGLASHGQLGQLKLRLGCRTVDQEVARRVVAPLSKLPRVADLRVSFSKPPQSHSVLSQLAVDTVQSIQSVANETPSKPFRFFDLPVELQLQILEHTSLRHGNTIRSRPGHPDEWVYLLPICPRNKDRCHNAFCMWRTAGFSESCLAYRPTLSWCRVSRRFADLVKRVFFSMVDVQVLGWDGKDQGTPFTNADTDPCAPKAFVDFLRRYRDAGMLRYIRSLTFVFPYITDTYLNPERRAWKLWFEAAEIMARAEHVSKVEIKIKFSDGRTGRDGCWQERHITEDKRPGKSGRETRCEQQEQEESGGDGWSSYLSRAVGKACEWNSNAHSLLQHAI